MEYIDGIFDSVEEKTPKKLVEEVSEVEESGVEEEEGETGDSGDEEEGESEDEEEGESEEEDDDEGSDKREECSEEIREFKKISVDHTILEEMKDLISSIKKFKKDTLAEMQDIRFDEDSEIDLSYEINAIKLKQENLTKRNRYDNVLRNIREFKMDSLSDRKHLLQQVKLYEKRERTDISDEEKMVLFSSIKEFELNDIRRRYHLLENIRDYEEVELKKLEAQYKEDIEKEEVEKKEEDERLKMELLGESFKGLEKVSEEKQEEPKKKEEEENEGESEAESDEEGEENN